MNNKYKIMRRGSKLACTTDSLKQAKSIVKEYEKQHKDATMYIKELRGQRYFMIYTTGKEV